MQFEQLTSNLSTRPRRAVVNGRKGFIADAVLIPGDGVLNGSRGRLFYPAAEVGKREVIESWDGVPMVVYHPQKDGVHVSASDPDIIRDSGIGYILHNDYDGKHRSKLWFDEEHTRNYDQKLKPEHKILPRLERGEPISLSTGLYTDNVPGKGVAPDGREYDATALGYKPDHLAILPDQRGACSIEDGCGVNVNAFCATGEGGGQDNSCSPGGGSGTSGPISHGGEALRQATYEQLDTHVDGLSKSQAMSAIKRLFGSDRRAKGASLAKMKETIRQELYSKKGRMDKGEVIKAAVHGKKDDGPLEAIEVPDDTPLTALDVNLYKFMADRVITGNLRLDELIECQDACDDDQDCVDECLDDMTGNAGKYGNVQSTSTGKFKKFGAGYGSGAVHESAQRGHMQFSERDRELGASARAEKEATGHNPASWVADEAIWEKAKAAADKGYDESDEQYWAVVAHIYGKMGGEVKSKTNNTEDDDDDTQWITMSGARIPIKDGKIAAGPFKGKDAKGKGKKDKPKETTDKHGRKFVDLGGKAEDDADIDPSGVGGDKGPHYVKLGSDKAEDDADIRVDQLSDRARLLDDPHHDSDITPEQFKHIRNQGEPMTRQQIINALTTNCDCWKGAKDVLNGMTDERLQKLHANHEAQAKATIIVNAAQKSNLVLNAEGVLVANETCPECGGEMTNGVCDCGYGAEETAPPKKKGPPPAMNTDTTTNKSRLTPDEQADIAYARKMRVHHKQQLIRSIVANSGVQTQEQQLALVKTLNAKSADDLEVILQCQPQQPTRNRQDDGDVSWFFGNAGGSAQVHNRMSEDDAESMRQDAEDMEPPTINYEELVGTYQGAGAARMKRA